MKRRLFTILSALSLVLFVAVCVLWMRSSFRDDTYAWYSDYEAREHWHVNSSLGGLTLCCSVGYPNDMLRGFRSFPIASHHRDTLLGDVLNDNRRRVSRGFAGFWRYHKPRSPTSPEYRFWGLPYWFLFALSAPVPLVSAMRWRRRRQRQGTGQCLGCGYDLRATPGRCPECGLVPAAPPPSPPLRGNER